ncbi:MAG: fumarylacetoacetate hydrolase family protein [Polyangiaceae bacterium]
MKLVTFVAQSDSQSREIPGAFVPSLDASKPARSENRVLDLTSACGAAGRSLDASSLLRLIEGGDVAHDAMREAVDLHALGKLPEKFKDRAMTHALADVSLLSPLPRPPSMRDGYAFRQHVETARRNRGLDMIPEFDQFPVFYFTNHQAVIGPGPLHVLPRHLEKLDFELEAAIVIGKKGRNIPANRADEMIFGLTIMNDFSARTLQMDEMKLNLGPAKGKDFATALGPVIVTMDELASKTKKTPNGNQFDLTMTARLNGKELSRGNVKDMNWTFAQIIERASYGVTLYPGDVIGSGTCGTGCLLELNGSKITDNLWMKPGDVIELEIEDIGKLVNEVVQGEVVAKIG